jgi:hypothetical protein
VIGARKTLCILAVSAVVPGGAFGQATGFAALAGSWSGSGTISLSSGATERLRCDATYEVAPSGNSFQQNLRCKSDSYDFNLRTSVIRSGGNISGTWSETRRNVQGNITGRASDRDITATVQGPAFSASLTMQTQAGNQTVRIRSEGTELSAVSISLRRGG